MAGQRISGVGVAAIGAGAVFLYSALKGKSVLATFQTVIKGQSPGAAAAAAPITGSSASSAGGGGPPGGQIPANGTGSVSAAANRALGQIMAAAYGWTGEQWLYLKSGWQEESGWSVTAANPASQAYGIPQANPGSKMASAGPNWQTSAATQIKWGLAYIAAEYGSPMGVPLWSASGPLPGYVGY